MSRLSACQYPQEVYWPPKCVWADVRPGMLLLKARRWVAGSSCSWGGAFFFGGGAVSTGCSPPSRQLFAPCPVARAIN